MKTIKVGNITIPIYPLKDGRHMIVYRELGRKFRRPYKSLARAKMKAEETAIRLSNGRLETADFTAADREIYLHAKNLITPLGLSLATAAERFTQEHRNGAGAPTADVVEQLITSKSDHSLNARYMRGLQYDLRAFATKFSGRPIGEITATSIEKYLRDFKVGPRRRNNIRDELVTLFRFARERGHLPDRTTEAEKVGRIKHHRGPVTIYTPSELQIFLAHIRADWLPWLVLGAFAGVRSEEISRLQWTDFNWEKRFINVRAEAAKTGDRRLVPLRDNLFTWLAPWHKATGAVCITARHDREAERLAKASGIKWRNNALRHSYGSYRMAELQNMPQLAYEMGNSIAIIKRHYHEAVHQSEAAEYFGIFRPEFHNVIQLNLGIAFGKK